MLQELCSSSIHKPNISISSITSSSSDSMQCRRCLHFYHGLHILALEHARMLLLSNNVTLVRLGEMYVEFQLWGGGWALYLSCETC